ncbi:MAG: ROK family protein, partial [Marmoricola sp.]
MSSDAGDAARTAPGSAAALRVANQRRVLSVLLNGGTRPATQADITRETGLAAGTVSTIVRELAAAGVVSTVAGSGRRGTTVRLARGAGLVAGVDFGHSHIALAIGEMSGEVLAEDRRPLPPGHSHTEGLECASAMLDTLLAQVGADRSELRNIGMGLPAPLSDGVVMSSAIEPGWVGVNARDEASAAFGVDVLIENDANHRRVLSEHHNGGTRPATQADITRDTGLAAGTVSTIVRELAAAGVES